MPIQRWGSVPKSVLPLRQIPVFGRNIPMVPMVHFIDRQVEFGQVRSWLEDRCASYLAQWTGMTPIQLKAESALDLVAWQRRSPDAQATARFVRDHEEATQFHPKPKTIKK